MDEDRWLDRRGTFNTGYFPALMNYFVKFVGAYEQNGIPINYLSVQNEPLFQTSSYPTMFMTPPDEGRFISQYLGPALRKQRFRRCKKGEFMLCGLVID
jgi:O-glycosyl hydrolase